MEINHTLVFCLKSTFSILAKYERVSPQFM